jgi:hypothetical protein
MRKRKWQIAALFIGIVSLSSSFAYAQGLHGWLDVHYNTSKEYEDGDKTSERDVFNRNLNLDFQKPVTPMLSYKLYLRTNFTDTDQTDIEGDTSTTYRRSIEPSIDIMLNNPMYDLNAGYRRLEDWDTAHLNDGGRTTTEFYYSRFNMSPQALPSLNLEFDEQKISDHFDDPENDDTITKYSIGSNYELPSREAKLGYTLYYSYTTNRTPLDPVTSKTVINNFNSNYNAGYSGSFWRRKASYAVLYQGNYARVKNEEYVVQTGTILNERAPLGGFYAQGTDPPPNDNVSADVLAPQGNLIDDNLQASTGVGLSTIGNPGDKYQNIGILVSSQRSVDRLFIYANRDIRGESRLNNANNWLILKSNFNQADTWTEVAIKQVTIDTNTVDDEFRYEIEFLSPQSASFFKAVNLETSSVIGVEVTEIEAYGQDDAGEDVLETVATTFTQGVNFIANVRALPKLTLAFNYSLDRSDQNPISLGRSVGEFFENIVSDSVSGDKHNFRSDISRNYGATSTWLAHRFLTTILRVQRSESFDNNDETDVSSNNYNLSLNSAPLPTLDTTLSLIRNDSFNFNDKTSTSDSLLLSITSKLYRDVNSITDFSYTRSESFDNDTTTTVNQVTGSVDAVLRRELSGTVNYDFSWTSSDDTSTDLKEGMFILTYRPGRFINVNGNFSVSDTDGDVTTNEGVQMDWLPVRAIRLNMNYQHTNAKPGPVKTDSVGGYVIWYFTKFADTRITYNYLRQREDVKTEQYNFSVKVNASF